MAPFAVVVNADPSPVVLHVISYLLNDDCINVIKDTMISDDENYNSDTTSDKR